jgi:succinate dehydrogenase (ubiquinone) cytochrome b560 subunit
MKETGRPVSPHVTIYAFPIAALSSITNRATGIAMAVGCVGLGSAEIVGGSGTAIHMMQVIGSSGAIVAGGAKFSVVFPLVYHYLGAIRHFMWDNKPEMLTNVDVQKSSYYLFGAATVVAAGAAFL